MFRNKAFSPRHLPHHPSDMCAFCTRAFATVPHCLNDGHCTWVTTVASVVLIHGMTYTCGQLYYCIHSIKVFPDIGRYICGQNVQRNKRKYISTENLTKHSLVGISSCPPSLLLSRMLHHPCKERRSPQDRKVQHNTSCLLMRATQ